MWSTYIMDVLLFLMNFGCEIDPASAAGAFDFNGNGILDQHDWLELLSQQPPIPDEWTRPNCSPTR